MTYPIGPAWFTFPKSVVPCDLKDIVLKVLDFLEHKITTIIFFFGNLDLERKTGSSPVKWGRPITQKSFHGYVV
jgi:hypothetical protein